MSIYVGWSTSAASLANKSVPYVIFDEMDKYGLFRKEADPVSLGEKRARAFPLTRKFFKLSSPTIEAGPIWQGLLSCQFIFVFWARCPVCREYQLMEDKRIRVDKKQRDPEVIYGRQLARYQCVHCEAKWNDPVRDAALRGGEWRDKESGLELFACLRRHNPQKIGFHGPSWESPFVSN